MKNLSQIYLFVFCMTGLWGTVQGQNYELSPESQEAMKPLAFLEGKWKGTGWMMSRDQQKYEFEQTEEVSFQLSGTHLMIKGQGVSDGKVIHHALAMISPTSEAGDFDFTSFLQSGQKGSFKSELIDGVLYWYPNDQVRYVIRLNDAGQWYEVGEYNMGENWFQFFEMTLDKVD